MRDIDDKDLIIGLKNGDKDSYKQLFCTYYSPFYAFAKAMLKGDWIAEDIVQNVFVKVYTHRESLNENLSLYNYLFVLIKHESLNYIRTKNNLFEYTTQKLSEDVMPNDIESEYDAKELKQIVDEIIKQMPKKRRHIFILSRVQFMQNKEIADRLGISLKTVERHISLAIKDIRSKIKTL